MNTTEQRLNRLEAQMSRIEKRLNLLDDTPHSALPQRAGVVRAKYPMDFEILSKNEILFQGPKANDDNRQRWIVIDEVKRVAWKLKANGYRDSYDPEFKEESDGTWSYRAQGMTQGTAGYWQSVEAIKYVAEILEQLNVWSKLEEDDDNGNEGFIITAKSESNDSGVDFEFETEDEEEEFGIEESGR